MRRKEQQGSRKLGPATQEMLQLLARCPRIPTDVICQLLGTRHPGSTRQLLARLRGAGLAQLETVASGALLNGRTVRLWSLTTAGRAELAKQGPLRSSADLIPFHYGAPARLRDPARQAVFLLLAAYRALGTLVVALDMHPRPRVERCELPRSRSSATRGSARMRHVRLPAAAVLAAADSELVPVLILPDVGTAPVVANRPVLKRLLELRQISQTAEELLLVIVTTDLPTSGERPAAWRNLLHRVTAQAGEPPLRTRILTRPEEARTPNTKSQQRSTRDATQLDELFGLIARHPLLTSAQLACLLVQPGHRHHPVHHRLDAWHAGDRGFEQRHRVDSVRSTQR
jgi:hypothetical protein